jgi:hypothetical protein
MILDGKQIEEISIEDINTLINDQVRESTHIEYKSILPDQSQQSKHKYLAQVTSFANSGGGFLLFGIEEDAGLPTKIIGVELPDPDKASLALDHSMLNGISPRIPNVKIRSIEISKEKFIFIVRIGKSFSGPHMISLNDSNRFYSRSTAGKVLMDVNQIRDAFLQSDVVLDKIKEFRENRLNAIRENRCFAQIYGESKLVMHIIPFDSFSLSPEFNFGKIGKNTQNLRSPIDSYARERINIDGILCYTPHYEKAILTSTIEYFTQLYRTGIIEYVDSQTIRRRDNANLPHDLIIPSAYYEEYLIKYLDNLKKVFAYSECEGPFVLAISLINVKGYIMGLGFHEAMGQSIESNSMDRSDIILPELYLENLANSSASILKPAFDLIWNACGHEKSLNFDDNGNWKKRN